MSTNKERVASYKARLKARGFVSLTVQVHREDKEKVKAFAKKLFQGRTKNV